MIEVRGLTKQYGAVRAVDDITFDVKPGVVTGFLGPNGAGKSTTMRMIVGLDNPTAGTATIGGTAYRKLKNPLRTVGALLDAQAVHPNRSAANHLKWIAQTNGIPTTRVDEVLELVGLTSVASKKAGGFSLGMGQRLGLAAALLGDPEVLILDEPVNGLDPEGIRWVREFLRSLAQQGRTVLVSSHLLSEMAQTADELVVIGRGKLVAHASTYDFIRESTPAPPVVVRADIEGLHAALQASGIESAIGVDEEQRPTLTVMERTSDEIGAIAFDKGIKLALLEQRRASLEEAFMRLTGGRSPVSIHRCPWCPPRRLEE